jgi:hypothetical protein
VLRLHSAGASDAYSDYYMPIAEVLRGVRTRVLAQLRLEKPTPHEGGGSGGGSGGSDSDISGSANYDGDSTGYSFREVVEVCGISNGSHFGYLAIESARLDLLLLLLLVLLLLVLVLLPPPPICI